MNLFIFIVQQTLLIVSALMVVALGGLFSERSGVVNIALEGIMMIGAFAGTLFIHALQGSMQGQLLFILALLVAAISGMVFAAFHAFASINAKADQTISGTALNMFATAFVVYVARIMFQTKNISFENTFFIQKIPVLGDIPLLGALLFQRTYITTYLAFGILVVSWFVLYKTRFGLRLRACGENPHAVDAAGLNVYQIRWIAVLISGALAGLGGLIYIVIASSAFSGTVSGYGFLALAILIFGQWKPFYILFSSFFFSIFMTISSASSIIPFMVQLKLPSDFIDMIPYIATLIILFFSSKKSRAPKASGEIFDKGKR